MDGNAFSRLISSLYQIPIYIVFSIRFFGVFHFLLVWKCFTIVLRLQSSIKGLVLGCVKSPQVYDKPVREGLHITLNDCVNSTQPLVRISNSKSNLPSPLSQSLSSIFPHVAEKRKSAGDVRSGARFEEPLGGLEDERVRHVMTVVWKPQRGVVSKVTERATITCSRSRNCYTQKRTPQFHNLPPKQDRGNGNGNAEWKMSRHFLCRFWWGIVQVCWLSAADQIEPQPWNVTGEIVRWILNAARDSALLRIDGGKWCLFNFSIVTVPLPYQSVRLDQYHSTSPWLLSTRGTSKKYCLFHVWRNKWFWDSLTGRIFFWPILTVDHSLL